jgi:aryl carrier-like protein
MAIMEEIPGDSKASALGHDNRNGDVYTAPQGDLEEALARIWCQVFRVERIGRDDNFFELGGDSVLGMSLTELLAASLSVQLPVVDLFQNPTIRELALLITPNGHS